MAFKPGSPVPDAEGKPKAQTKMKPPNSPIRTVPAAFKFVEDAVIFIKRTKLASKILVNLFGTFKLVLDMTEKKKREKKGYLRKCEHHTWYVSTGLFSILRSHTLTER